MDIQIPRKTLECFQFKKCKVEKEKFVIVLLMKRNRGIGIEIKREKNKLQMNGQRISEGNFNS